MAKNHLSRHHRKPRSLGGGNEDRNLSIVDVKKHQAYHTLFAASTPEKICEELNKYWIDPDYEVLCRKKDK